MRVSADRLRGRMLRQGPMIIGSIVAIVLLWTGVASAASATVVRHGPTDRKQIALTFDDNTSTSRALAVLRALQKNHVPATLFVIGDSVKALPAINTEIVKGMAAGFFEVGDHSRNHPVLTGLSWSAMAAQIGAGTDAFRAVTGARTVPLFRPPYGATNSTVAAVGAAEGFLYEVLWDVDPRDWAGGSAQSIADHVVSHAHNGAIVVMHMSGAHTAEAIPLMASRLRAKGYELVTVSHMLKGDRLFLDVGGSSELTTAIARMVDEGFMSGYDGVYFGPYDTINRAQVAKVATLVGGIHTSTVEQAENPTFTDVPVQHDSNGAPISYPFDFVEEAASSGLVLGTIGQDGVALFRPWEPITRGQFAQILARMCRELKGYADEVQPAQSVDDGVGMVAVPADVVPSAATILPAGLFTDVPDYAAADVALLARLGLMSGTSQTTFGMWAGAKRAHVALAMSRYLDLPVQSPLEPSAD